MNYLLILAESEPTSLGVIMAIVVAVTAVVTIFGKVIDYFIAELKRRQEEKKNGGQPPITAEDRLSRIEEALVEMRLWCRELHEWHAVESPTQPGVKVWWNAEEQKQQLREVEGKLDTAVSELVDVKASVARWEAERAELRAEITRWQDRYFRQQSKMEKLAVRVQRAVEAVAGLTPPEVESDLDDVDHEDQG